MGGVPERTVLGQRRIRLRADLGQQLLFGRGIKEPAASQPRFGSDRAGFAPLPLPATNRPVGDAKGAGGLRSCQPGVQGAQQAVAKIGRVLFHAGSIAPWSTLVQPALSGLTKVLGQGMLRAHPEGARDAESDGT